MKTVGDLRKKINELGLSPESAAEQVHISNMTLRRLLRRGDNIKLPPKHIENLRLLGRPQNSESFAFGSVDKLLPELQEAGEQIKSKSEVKKDLKKKLTEHLNIGADFKRVLSVVSKAAFSPKANKSTALAIGALLYFISPIDLIPDALPGIGLIDDFAVLSLVASIIIRQQMAQSTDSGLSGKS